MDQPISETPSCCCHQQMHQAPPPALEKPLEQTKKTVKAVPSVLLSVLIAFFPKCPICWAAYMSMFGSFGLAHTPYMGWLFPVLLAFLGLHLYLILRKSKQKGYGPFAVSLVGALLILGQRSLFIDTEWLLYGGMLFIFSGSLWNSFSTAPIKIPTFSLSFKHL